MAAAYFARAFGFCSPVPELLQQSTLLLNFCNPHSSDHSKAHRVASLKGILSPRDKTVLVWHLSRGEGKEYGTPRRALKGHSHFVQDVVISSDGQFALSGSWDGTLRLWDLNTGTTTRRFIGHTKDVLSVAFSVDNRQACIAS